MGNRTIEKLEQQQEDDRGALVRGAWLYIEREGDLFAVETSALPNTADVRAVLAPLGFVYNPKTGRFRTLIPDGEISLYKVGASVLPILGKELP